MDDIGLNIRYKLSKVAASYISNNGFTKMLSEVIKDYNMVLNYYDLAGINEKYETLFKKDELKINIVLFEEDALLMLKVKEIIDSGHGQEFYCPWIEQKVEYLTSNLKKQQSTIKNMLFDFIQYNQSISKNDKRKVEDGTFEDLFKLFSETLPKLNVDLWYWNDETKEMFKNNNVINCTIKR